MNDSQDKWHFFCGLLCGDIIPRDIQPKVALQCFDTNAIFYGFSKKERTTEL